MGGMVPSPVALGAALLLKGSAYTAVGWLASRWARSRLTPLSFGAIRVTVGWLVGAPALLVALSVSASVGGGAGFVLALLTLPRYALWWAVLRGSWIGKPPPEIHRLCLAGVVLSSVTDLVLLLAYRNVEAFSFGIC